MQTNRVLIISFLLLVLISCKRSNVKQENLNSTETEENISSNGDEMGNDKLGSFVASCGSGCAMTYTPEEMVKNGNSITVKFKVEMYIDTELDNTSYETYIFSYNESNEIQTIRLEDDPENILETLMPDGEYAFRDFAGKLINCSNEVKSKETSSQIKIFSDNSQKTEITLPFSFENYLNTLYIDPDKFEDTYPSYPLSEYIVNYLSSKNSDYMGEEYKGFILPSNNDYSSILMAISRGDSEYFFILTHNENEISDITKIGNIGDSEPIFFTIDKNYLIHTYRKENQCY